MDDPRRRTPRTDAVLAAPGSPRQPTASAGVVVHTNLGRAPLSPAAVEAITIVAGATDVETDLATEPRGPRGTGALAALAAALWEAREPRTFMMSRGREPGTGGLGEHRAQSPP